jgi:hypothetical protein
MRDARAINDKVRLLAKLRAALIEALGKRHRFPAAVASVIGWDKLARNGFHRLGRLRDRAVEAQQYRASGLVLVTAAIALWNTYISTVRSMTYERQRNDLGSAACPPCSHRLAAHQSHRRLSFGMSMSAWLRTDSECSARQQQAFARPVHLAGLILTRRQTKIRPEIPGFVKPRRIVDGRLVRHRNDRADTGAVINRRQTTSARTMRNSIRCSLAYSARRLAGACSIAAATGSSIGCPSPTRGSAHRTCLH